MFASQQLPLKKMTAFLKGAWTGSAVKQHVDVVREFHNCCRDEAGYTPSNLKIYSYGFVALTLP